MYSLHRFHRREDLGYTDITKQHVRASRRGPSHHQPSGVQCGGGNRDQDGGHEGGHGGGRGAHQGGARGGARSVNQPRDSDLREHLSQRISLRERLENSKDARHAFELRRREDYDRTHGAPRLRNASAGFGPSGLNPFTHRLRNVVWPKNFKLHDLPTYDGKANPEQWLILYEIAVRAAGGSKDVMANYLPVPGPMLRVPGCDGAGTAERSYPTSKERWLHR